MPVVDKNQLKIWFKNLAKPVQEQFWNWMDSFYHKSEAIPKSGVENLVEDLAKKADLVGGVVPASQLPFSVNTSEVIAIGNITATEDTVTLAVHSSGANVVRVDGVVHTRNFPNNFTFTPVSTGSKFLILYAVNDAGIFRLAQGVEDLEAVEPELPVGALFVRRILVNSAGADVELPSLTGFREKIEDEWKVFTFIEALTPKLLPFSTDKKTSFVIEKSSGVAGDLWLGGIKVNTSGLDYWWSGKEFTIKNNTSNNLILLSASNYTGVGIKFNLSQNLTVGAGKSIKVKASLDGSFLEVLEFSSAVDLSTKQDRLQSVTGNIGVGKTDASATEKLDVVGRVKSDGLVLNETTSAILPKEIKFKAGKIKAALNDGVEKAILLEGDVSGFDFNALVDIFQYSNFQFIRPSFGTTNYFQYNNDAANVFQAGHVAFNNASTYQRHGIQYKSATTTVGRCHGNFRGFIEKYSWSSFNTSVQFAITTNIPTQRVFVGYSDQWRQPGFNPTNVAMNTLTDVIGVCMESGSSNLFIIHNDATGTANLINTGFTHNTNYIYILKISKKVNTTTINVVLERIDGAGVKTVFNYDITNDYTTFGGYLAMYCIDSLGVTETSFVDFGSLKTKRLNYLA